MKIAIIGAGPRGLLMAEALLKQTPIPEIHLFDPHFIGGQTWQTTQNKELFMNTPAEKIQQFEDSPTLFTWSQKMAAAFIKSQPQISDDLIKDTEKLTHNGYAPRRLYGAYLQEMFQQLAHLDHLHFHQVAIKKARHKDGKFKIIVDGRSTTFDDVIITVNNGHNHPTDNEQALSDYAKQNALTYVRPINDVTQINFATMPADQPIIVRGLGLTFNDVVSQLTQQRGGQFSRDDNNVLHYQATGQEPHIIAGSRRGLPPYPKPISQAGKIGAEPPLFLTIDNIKQRVHKGATTYQAFHELLHLEIEYRYYSNIVQKQSSQVDLKAFQQAFVKQQQLPNHPQFKDSQRINWEQLNNPVAGTAITTVADYQKTVSDWLTNITTDAQLGTKDALISAGLNASRALRNTIKNIFTHFRELDDSFTIAFLSDFVPTDVFLTSGAPNFRVEQLNALIKANVVTILPPQMNIIGANHSFMAYSKFYPKEIYDAKTVIEARMPKANVAQSQNPIIKQLFSDGLLSSPQITINQQTYQLRSVNINHYNQVIDQNDHVVDNLFVFSELSEGTRWLTNICPRTGDDISRKQARQMATVITSK